MFARAARLFAQAMPQDCQLCGISCAGTICESCKTDLPIRSESGCKCCGQIGDEQSLAGETCGDCLTNIPHFDTTKTAFVYAFPLDKLIQSFKFNANLSLVGMFADQFVASLKSGSHGIGALPDIIIPMPLAKRRLAARGFNQSALLARDIGKQLGVKVESRGLVRVRDTPPQAGLDREARLANMKDAFDCGQDLAGLRIAIVDDVMTTGATMSDAARALKKQGVSHVEAWVIARASK